MRKIIYTQADGRVAVVTPIINTLRPDPATGNLVQHAEEISEAAAEQRAWDGLPKDAINPQWVDGVPSDRTFRDAWTLNGSTIEHDMAKCREIHKGRLREIRAPKLQALDAEYMKADEAGDSLKKAAIAAKKQALRDVTKDARIAAAASPEELKSVIPDALK